MNADGNRMSRVRRQHFVERILEAQSALFEANESVLADDDVIEQLDVEHFACLA